MAAGQTVVFKNMDTVAHHVLLDDGNTQTADIAPGATSAAVTIGANKSYHCTIHPGMVGGFNGTEVEPPPNCNMAYCGRSKGESKNSPESLRKGQNVSGSFSQSTLDDKNRQKYDHCVPIRYIRSCISSLARRKTRIRKFISKNTISPDRLPRQSILLNSRAPLVFGRTSFS